MAKADSPAASHSPDTTIPIDGIAEAYSSYYGLLAVIAGSKFGVPQPDVRGLVHDVFVSLLRQIDNVRDIRSWLVGAMCNACRDYVAEQIKRTTQAIPTETIRLTEARIEASLDRIAVAHALHRLPERDRHVLHMRFVEGRSPAEIASAFGITEQYARNLTYRCLSKAREILATPSNRVIQATEPRRAQCTVTLTTEHFRSHSS